MWNIIGYRKVFLGFSLVIVMACVAAVGVFGFRRGVEFTGGTLWELKITNPPALTEFQSYLRDSLGLSEAQASTDAARQTFFVRMPTLSESDHQRLLGSLKSRYPGAEELGFQSIGPSVGAELRRNATIALVLALVGISFYIAFAFRKVSRPVSSWKYGIITLLTLFHDVALPAGLLALLGRYKGIEIDGNFIVALLVVAGFSVHDTIVVFDRIRENLSLDRGKTAFAAVINRSVNQTLARSVNTSLTLILVLLSLYFVGPASLRYFVLTLLVGVATGIYSSIFVASPALLLLQRKGRS